MTRVSSSLVHQNLLSLDDALITYILSFFVDEAGISVNEFQTVCSVCSRLHTLVNHHQLWSRIPLIQGGTFNQDAFKMIKFRATGSEGKTFHTFCRPHQREYAIRRARIKDNGDIEGVPYYTLRAIAALRRLHHHPNLIDLLGVSLHESKLYTIFPYVERTLEDVLNDIHIANASPAGPAHGCGGPGSGSGSSHLPAHISLTWLGQLVAGIAHLHSCGLLHRNLKPKHILVCVGGCGSSQAGRELDGSVLKISDFMAVRYLRPVPAHQECLTAEVVSLWYRPPEVLMGQRNYSFGVDMWSLGLIFAEMLLGEAVLRGSSEIDQLFKIFELLGTPSGGGGQGQGQGQGEGQGHGQEQGRAKSRGKSSAQSRTKATTAAASAAKGGRGGKALRGLPSHDGDLLQLEALAVTGKRARK